MADTRLGDNAQDAAAGIGYCSSAKIDYNGKSQKLAITFHPNGIKALAGEVNEEVAR